MTDTTTGGSPVVKTEQPRCPHKNAHQLRCIERAGHAFAHMDAGGEWTPEHADDCPGCAADEPDALDVDTVLTWALSDMEINKAVDTRLLAEFLRRGWATHSLALTDAGRARLEGLR